jgi:hypothetical protein
LFVLREKYRWLVADKPSEHAASGKPFSAASGLALFDFPCGRINSAVRRLLLCSHAILRSCRSAFCNDKGYGAI